ncbi:MAG: PspC domain-containing protein [Flavobacteriia bacterium]|nr:PspC domain-containing protein [Flavobacteriia bacterium]
MKKTISIHIKGFPFIMEEDAFNTLKKYLDSIEFYLKNNPDVKEIVSDIEFRIAELCQALIKDNKQVVDLNDVNSILETLGKPEDFSEFGEQNDSFDKADEQVFSEKRLYRDMEEAKIAGVCAGISNYFVIDVIIIRIIFFFIFLFGGFGIPLYLILWIVIPKANSKIDRLKMYGKPITLDNLKEEFESAADRVKKQSESFVNEIKKDVKFKKRFFSIGNVFRKLISIFLILFGLLFLAIFLILFLGFMGIIPIQSNMDYIQLSDLNVFFFNNHFESFWIFSGLFLFGFSLVLLFLTNGIYLFWNIKNSWKKAINFLLSFLNIVGVVLCIYSAVQISTNFTSYAKLEKKVNTFSGEKLEIICKQKDTISGYNVKRGGLDQMLKIDKQTATFYYIPFKIKESKDSLFHVFQEVSSNGKTFEEAKTKALQIKNNFQIEQNTLKIKPYYTFPVEDKFRNQKLKWIIEVPKNKKLIINQKIRETQKEDEEEECIEIYAENN